MSRAWIIVAKMPNVNLTRFSFRVVKHSLRDVRHRGIGYSEYRLKLSACRFFFQDFHLPRFRCSDVTVVHIGTVSRRL